MNVQAPEGSGGSTGPAELAQPSGLKWTDATALMECGNRRGVIYGQAFIKTQIRLSIPHTNIAGTSRISRRSSRKQAIIPSRYRPSRPSGSTDYTDGRESAGSAAYSFVKKDDQGFILISTPDELLALAEAAADLTKNYKLANDLDMEGLAGKVIGKYNNGASGEKSFYRYL